ncbi:uncharacterized protein LOC126398734 isoform X1 [Epinephelus moara]|uniref:uncharacterized protein LOC126398734 isoform X1 n=1 Tax=Epinephelus moara TaxID=300413 RepID=UPI00214EC2D6|nr:uncharacterized protein LOC126398734 isoform X1 [Epinephelus moara]
MVKIRWIEMSLFMKLLLQFTAVTGQYSPSFVVSDGDDVTLPCGNVIDDRSECEGAYWIFSSSLSTFSLMLVDQGQIEAKSDRLSVTENCSLVMKKVTFEDVGRYSCRQFESGHGDAHVHLSIISMTEDNDADGVTLNCSVLTHDWCIHTLEWLYEGKTVDEDMEKSQSECSVTVTFPTTHPKQKPQSHELFKCKVTDDFSGDVQLFTFSRPQTSGEKPVQFSGWLRCIVVCGGLTTLIIIAVAVNIWTRKGKSQMDDNAVHDDDDDGTVIYENVGEPSASVRLHSPST